METSTLQFHSGAGLTGQVDTANSVIHGVALIHGGIEAEGHGLWTDGTTLTQMSAQGKEKGRIPVNLDHGSGISATCGYIDGFRIDGNVLRGDLHLLKTHDETPTILERAEVMPTGFGLSAAFKGNGQKMLGGKKVARVEKLLSFDLVCRPAAAPNGLFSAKDEDQLTREKVSMNRPGQATEPTLTDILNGLNALTGRIDQMQGIQDQLVEHANQSTLNQGEQNEDQGIDPQVLAELEAMSDEELAQYNEANGLDITRADIDTAVGEFLANNPDFQGQQNEGEGDEGQGDFQGEGQGELAGVGAGSGGAGGSAGETAFRALQKQIIQLQSRLDREDAAKKQESTRIQFEAIENKFNMVAGQRNELKEFAENLVAENEALRMHVRTGTRPVKVGVDDGVRLFSANDEGELHQFQAVVKNVMTQRKCTEGQAIAFAIKQPGGNALHKDWLMSMQRTRN